MPRWNHLLALALLSTSVGACAPGCGGSRHVAAALPGSGSLTLLACSETEAWIGTWRTNHDLAEGRTDALLLRVGADGAQSALAVPGDFVSTFQPTTGNGGWAVTVEVQFLEVTRSHLIAVQGQRQEPLAVPPGTFGAAFISASHGYAWRGAAVNQTMDGGRTWWRTRIDPGEIRRGPGSGPRLSPGGDLWVPVQRPDGGALLVVQGDRTVRRVAEWGEESIESVRLSQDETSYAVVRPDAASGFRVLAFPAAGGALREVYRHPTGSVVELTVSGPRLALLVVDGAPPSTFLGTWPRDLHVSVDGGRTWTVRSMTSEATGSICATASGIWATSTRDRNVSLIRW